MKLFNALIPEKIRIVDGQRYSRISLARLVDYARERRPAGLELERHIKAEFLKKSALVGRSDTQ